MTNIEIVEIFIDAGSSMSPGCDDGLCMETFSSL